MLFEAIRFDNNIKRALGLIGGGWVPHCISNYHLISLDDVIYHIKIKGTPYCISNSKFTFTDIS